MVKPGCNVVKKMTKQNAKTTIQRFMKKTTFKRKAHYLKTLCADSGACFAFGKEIKRLMSFFEFRTFKYSTLPFRSIGEVSANGFVKEISYEREGYKAYAALKSSLRASADNLAYEYLVGESELSFCQTLEFNGVNHFLIHPNEKEETPYPFICTSKEA
jgi:hypothetical protein